MSGLLLITALWNFPEDVAGPAGFLISFGGEWLIRILALLLSFPLAMIAIGPYRVQAWIKWASPGNSAPTLAPPTAKTGSAVGVYREPVGATPRDPLQVEEES